MTDPRRIYEEAVEAADGLLAIVDIETWPAIEEALRLYGEGVAEAAATLRGTALDQRIAELETLLTVTLLDILATARRRVADQTVEVFQEAQRESGMLAVALGAALITLNEQLADTAWQDATVLAVAEASGELREIVRKAQRARVSREDIAAGVRAYWSSQSNMPESVREAARTVVQGKVEDLTWRLERVAMTETQVARAVGSLAVLANDPRVIGVRFTLSRNRGSQRRPCVCDTLAGTDWYGMGPGVFPVGRAPLAGHPNCRCLHVPVLLQPGQRPPAGVLRIDDFTDLTPARAGELTPRAQGAIRRAAEALVRGGPA